MSRLTQEKWQTLRDEIEQILKHHGIELWDVEYKTHHKSPVLRVFIDKPGKVTLDDCAEMSRKISMMLDVEDLISDSYNLEVSSPGMDRKLVKPEHYERFTGRNIRVKLKADVSGRKKYHGRLETVAEDKIELFDDNEKQKFTLKFSDIDSARLEIEL